MKNKLFLIGLVLLGVLVGLIIYLSANSFWFEKSPFTAGWFDFLFGGLDCASRIARCTNKMTECTRKIRETAGKCQEKFEKDMQRCNKYRQKADSYLPKCQEKLTQCQLKAQRYISNPTRYNRYLSNCTARNTRCLSWAQKRRAYMLEKAEACTRRAKERKESCDAKYIEWQARNIERCTRQGRSCLDRIRDKCGSLIP